MTIKEKKHFNRSEIDDVLESAIEWQERARQNHGMTLDIGFCIGAVLKFGYAAAMSDVAENLNEILEIAKAENHASR